MKFLKNISRENKFLIYAIMFTAIAVYYSIKWYLLSQIADTPKDTERLTYYAMTVVFCTLYSLILVVLIVNYQKESNSNKFINLALWKIEQLEEKLIEKTPEASPIAALDTAKNWPWGDHHTELLGHLSAAAWRHWKLYDPSDIGSAPTNRSVADWLIKERKVSKTMAEAIATILRIDGLRTGPRE